MKILMVLTSHDRLGDTGLKTGFWLHELAPQEVAHQRVSWFQSTMRAVLASKQAEFSPPSVAITTGRRARRPRVAVAGAAFARVLNSIRRVQRRCGFKRRARRVIARCGLVVQWWL